MKTKIRIVRIVLAGLVVSLLNPVGVQAATLTSRSATVSTSAGAATNVTYTIRFNPGTNSTVGSVMFEICDSPLSAVSCAGSGDSSGASLAGAATTGPTGTNWTGGTWASGGTTGPGAGGTSIRFTNSGTAINPTTANQGTWALTGVTNPTTANRQYYLRITTYSDTAYSVPVDYGAIALGTSQQITVTGTMPESLVFCVGTSGTDCSNMTGSNVSLGTFSPTSTNTGTSLMSVSTNAGSGYVITINGTTLQSGANSITAMGTQALNSTGCSPSCSSTFGSSQFGTNVRANTTPSVGANVTGSGSGTGSGGYNTVNSFRFFSGDTVASASGPTAANLFTNSYIVNVSGDQAAGTYAATMTYICTATF